MSDLEQVYTWRFRAADTWFFRESRPMESLGGSELSSTFPPSIRTVMGAVRTAVGNQHGMDWQSDWRNPDKHQTLKTRIGDVKSFGRLRVSGVWLVREVDGEHAGSIHERLFPVPRCVVTTAAKQGNGIDQVTYLQLGDAVVSDLGQVRLPVLPESVRQNSVLRTKKWRTPENCWLSGQALHTLLSGKLCDPVDFIPDHDLFADESRLGIARDNRSRGVETGLLYQTKHIRPLPGVSVETDIQGLVEEDLPKHGDQQHVRFGGEGRMAGISVRCAAGLEPLLPTVEANADTQGIWLVFLTDAEYPANKDDSPLPGFLPTPPSVSDGETTCWQGCLYGINLTLHAAVVGKAVREGGWDLVEHQPRPVRSLIPAGSVYYLTVDDGDIQQAINALHLKQLTETNEGQVLGRGLMAVGLWQQDKGEVL